MCEAVAVVVEHQVRGYVLTYHVAVAVVED